MRKLLLYLLTISYSMFIASCGTQQTIALKPDIGVAKKSVLPLSSINLPISINCLAIENNINKQFNGIIYNDESFENNNNDNLIVKITKLADFKITGSGDKISFTAPIEIYVKGRLKKDFFSMFDQTVGVDQSKEATFKINLTINSKIAISNNWDIQTTSEANFQWREKPYLELGLIKIPIGTAIESILNLKAKDINAQLDQEISKLLKIKPLVEKYWNEFQQAQLISETYKSHLLIAPESIAVSKINCNGTNILFYVGIKAGISIISGEKPAKTMLKPLPNLSQNQKFDSSFTLYCKAAIDYNQASLLANSALAEKTFEFNDKKEKVTIHHLTIFNNGDRIGAKINLTAIVTKGIFTKKIDAELYALGTPFYDKESQQLKINNFDFDVKSKNALVGPAAFLLKNTLKKQIEQQLAYPMKSQMAEVQGIANNALKNANFKNIKLNGKLKQFEPGEILLEENTLSIQVACEGNLTVAILGF